MIGRIVEIAEDRRHLAVDRGFLVIRRGKDEVGRVPLDDIAAVIANAHGLSYSNNVLVALASRGVALVICGANHAPSAILWSVESHHRQAGRLDAQLAATRPMGKRLWAQIVRAKITRQADVLRATHTIDAPVRALARRVRSGDPDNVEAQAARKYWPLLMGEDFRRRRELAGTNALLNYGYTVLRAATARAVLAAGLYPALGLHHRSSQNPMRLVDDLMEPFRPLIDFRVAALIKNGQRPIDPQTKRLLAETLYHDLPGDEGERPVMAWIQHLATSLALLYEGQKKELTLPDPLPEKTWAMLRALPEAA